MLVTGPYGIGANLPPSASSLVLISGGIGVTPCISLLRGLMKDPAGKLEKVKFIWIARDVEMVELFEDVLESALDLPMFEVLFYHTKSGIDVEALQGRSYIRSGRPGDLKQVIDTGNHASHVLACGPVPLVNSAREAARDLSYTFHSETFEL